MKGSGVRYVVLALVGTAIILLDQATKLHIMQVMRLHESFPVIPDVFSITYIRNPGAAFGLLASRSSLFRLVFFGIASVCALILLATIFIRLRQDELMGQLSVVAIFGGAVGNLV